jgi:predicted oxidoreductase (fatty acid repression mutant protein)
MSNDRVTVDELPANETGGILSPIEFTALLASRRSIRRLQDGPFSIETQERIEDAIRYTPAAYNLPSFHVLFVRAERNAFWSEVEAGFRERLDSDRLERYLHRVDGFRNGTAVIVIYEDRLVHPQLRDAWNLSDAQTQEFSQQTLGMLQLSIWLALTAEGLVSSLQHWDWLLKARLETFFGLPEGRFHLTAVMPIGYPAEQPRENEPIAMDRILSRDRYQGT